MNSFLKTERYENSLFYEIKKELAIKTENIRTENIKTSLLWNLNLKTKFLKKNMLFEIKTGNVYSRLRYCSTLL